MVAQNNCATSDTNADASSASTGLIAPIAAFSLGGAAAAGKSLSTSTSAEESSATTASTTTTRITTTAISTSSHLDAKSSSSSSQTTTKNNDDDEQKKCSKMNCYTLFVWDFDWTIVNCNSDEYIPAQFLGTQATTRGFRNLYSNGNNKNHPNDKTTKGNWHACVEQMVHRAVMRLLHQQQQEQGGDAFLAVSTTTSPTDRIMDAARQMPFLIPVKETLQAVNEKRNHPYGGTGQMILSDGNTLFLNAFLQHNMPNVQFTHGVISNHGSWQQRKVILKQELPDEQEQERDQQQQQQQGLLVGEVDAILCVVQQSQQYGGHDCPYGCSANLCKSQALRETLKEYHCDDDSSDKGRRRHARHRRPARIVYIGDGANDACPVLNVLERGDVLLARVGKKRVHANDCKGPESDQEAANRNTTKNHDDHDSDDHDDDKDAEELEGACFGIMPALDKAKKQENHPNIIPTCQVYEWTTGAELQQLVLKLLQELPPPPPPPHQEKEDDQE